MRCTNMLCLLLSVIILCSTYSPTFSQVNLFTETFNELNGSTTGTSAEGIPWSTTCVGCFGTYEVNNGVFRNNNTKAVGFWATDDIDISSCVRIEVSFDYAGDPYPGSGNLESNDECNMGGACLGDINMPSAAGCANCWDFMDFKIEIDGTFSPIGIIGTTNTPTSFQFSYENEDCSGIGDLAALHVTSQTWAAAEEMTFDNVSLICYDQGAVTGTLTGGGELCGESCTTVDWEISGGISPYLLEFNFTLGAFDIDFTVPGASSTGLLNVCLDPDIVIPFFNAGTNTLVINESFGTDLVLELLSISDNTGCTVDLMNQIVDINIIDPPTINNIPPIDGICVTTGGMGTIDLTDYDDDVDGNGNTVTWYSDPGLNNEIGPIFTTSTNTTIYATVSSSPTCVSDDIQVQIVLTLAPEINNPGIVESCGEYELPPISGNNVSANAAYYDSPGGMGSVLPPGTLISTNMIIYIYDVINGCEAEEQFTVTILPEPEIDPISPITACGEYVLPEISGNNLSPFPVYNTLPGGMGMSFQPGETITSSIVLYAHDMVGNCFDDEFFTILISQEPEIDLPLILSACGGVILPEITGNNTSGNGLYYSGTNQSGASYMPGDIITESILLFAYDAIGTCDDEAEISINVTAGPLLDDPTDVDICDFYELPDFTGSDLNNPFYLDQNGNIFEPGDSVFSTQTITLYDSLVENGNCFSEVDFNITLIENPNAGDSIFVNTCPGSILDIMQLLSNDTDTTGILNDLANTGALSNDTLDLNLSGEQLFVLQYITENICSADTAYITIEVVDEANAGDDSDAGICEGSIITLSDYISGDPGGTFYLSTNSNPITNFDTDGLLGEIIEIQYIAGGGNSCPADTADLIFEVIGQPTFVLPLGIEVCEYYVLPEIQGSGVDNIDTYFLTNDISGPTALEGDTLFADQGLFLFFDDGNCTASDSVQVNVKNSTVENITAVLCPGDSIVVNNITYNENFLSDTQLLNNLAGCDSTININISYLEIDTNFINSTLCIGSMVIINGTEYDEDNASGIEILSGFSMNGCDSVIVINLDFTDSSLTPVSEMICETDSILINGIVYSVDNPTGIDTIISSTGCDSILDISLTFIESSDSEIDTLICENAEIEVNGTMYNMMNPSGVESIAGGNSQGCDSLVSVNLSFISLEQGIVEGTFCADETIDTLGVTFDINNPSQLVTLSGASVAGCDSTIEVNFSFIDVEEGLEMITLCTGATIEIQGTTYSESNTTGFFTEQTADGCDSIINVMVLFDDVNADFTSSNATCENEDAGYIIFENLNIASDQNFYILDNNDPVAIENGDTIFNIPIGDHNIQFTTDIGCLTEVQSITIAEASEFEISIPSFVATSENQGVQLNTSIDPTNTIVWSPDIDISCTDCANPFFSPSMDMSYFVEVTNTDGCIARDTIMIRVEQVFNIYIPNTFSPNDDGINELFFLSAEGEGKYDMYIYDRWGNKMFEGLDLDANQSDDAWNGRFNNQSLNPGVYAYYIEFRKTTDPEEEKSTLQQFTGSVTIIK